MHRKISVKVTQWLRGSQEL